MANANYELLRQAIARGAAAVLSLPSAGMVRNHKTRFLAEAENGFWVESVPEEATLIDQLILDESPVGMSFKSGHSSTVFAAVVRERNAAYPVNDQVEVDAIFLPFPEAYRENQRRQAYRVLLPIIHEVTVRMWRIPEHAILRDRPMAAQEVRSRLSNLSVMGMGAVCQPGKDGQPPRLSVNERLRIVMSYRGEDVLMEGRVVHARLGNNNTIPMGVQFRKLERDLEGRQTLSKLTAIVGELQRDEIRRRRAIADGLVSVPAGAN